jgi:hypothetical protein
MTHLNDLPDRREPMDQPLTGADVPSTPFERITLRAFRAVDDPVSCAEFVRQHVKVLEDIGVFTALQPDLSWCLDPNVTVLVAEHELLGMVAGIRLHRAGYDAPLPMERCMAGLADGIGRDLALLTPGGNAEIAGLWNAHRFAGRGIPKLLMGSAVAIASQLNLRTLVTFIAEYVAPYAAISGFVPMRQLPNDGIFTYPVPGIKTHAMILPDVLTLSKAGNDDRHRIVSLRLRTHQVRYEQPRSTLLQVHYALLDPSPSTDLIAGRGANAA